jgi:hypothetical protein
MSIGRLDGLQFATPAINDSSSLTQSAERNATWTGFKEQIFSFK